MVSSNYTPGIEKNIKESEGTLVLTWGPVTGRTTLTVNLARKHRKPCLVVDLSHGGDPQAVKDWSTTHDIKVLNVSGPRESKVPGIQEQSVRFLKRG
jgi:hypothetical protein